MKLKIYIKSFALILLTCLCIQTASAKVNQGVIINEFYWHTTGGGDGHYEAVELLVIDPNQNLNDLSVSDRNTWNKVSENTVTINDNNKGFLQNLKPGTLIVIYNGKGTDDIDASDYKIHIYAQSSEYATLQNNKYAFKLNDKGDNLHLFTSNQQLHFIKFRSNEYPKEGDGHPGEISWRGGKNGFIDVGLYRLNAGTKFIGKGYGQSVQHSFWQSYSLTYPVANNLGISNGDKNSEWIASLRNITLEQLNKDEGKDQAFSLSKMPFNKDNISIAPSRIDRKDFIIQSHRGAGKLLPENTMPAFNYGWSINTIPEADLHTTKDGIIVAIHDHNLKRLGKHVSDDRKKLEIADFSWDELKTIDVGSWDRAKYAHLRVPSIDDLFAELQDDPTRQMYLDIKDVDLEMLADKVIEYKVQNQVTLASKYHEFHKQWKLYLPETKTLQWIGGGQDAIEFTVDQLIKSNFDSLTSIQIHVRYDESKPDPFIPSSKYIAAVAHELHNRNVMLQVLPWKVWDQKVYWMLLDLGVDSFATDYPDVTTQAVDAYYKKHSK
ncbi:hypothetical protein JD969_08415 [Planctomycetota bacterium]|nr:hypothetical protein JD969_08415 [Planctomycetota bacterium]